MNPHALRPAVGRDAELIAARADRTADAAGRAVLAAWRRLVTGVTAAGDWVGAYRAAKDSLRGLAGDLTGGIFADLADAAGHAHTRAASAAVAHIPRGALSLAAARKVGGLRENEGGPPIDSGIGFPGEDAPVVLPIANTPEFIQAVLFPPPDVATLRRIILAGDWPTRIRALTKLASPEQIAGIVALGFQQGKTPRQIAQQLRPLLGNVQASARRVARTESVRVAHEMQLEAWEQAPDLIVGYQIHSMHFPATRHWHAARDGTIYWRDPAAGQKGFDKMPRPPLEAPDPTERPPGTPAVAPNCLCWLTPVLARNAVTTAAG